MSVHGRIISLAESLNRFRSLTDEETDWLEYSLRLDAQTEQRGRNRGDVKNFWDADIPVLERMLKNGKSPAQIAAALKRTPRAVYRKMYKMGLRCGQGSVAQGEAVE